MNAEQVDMQSGHVFGRRSGETFGSATLIRLKRRATLIEHRQSLLSSDATMKCGLETFDARKQHVLALALTRRTVIGPDGLWGDLVRAAFLNGGGLALSGETRKLCGRIGETQTM
jgi:hypothetical protein